MRVIVFTLQFDELTGKIDDAPLREFLRNKELLAIKDHFFIKDNIPYLTLLVTYHLTSPPPVAVKKSPEEKQEDWRALLKEEDKPLFNTLREWRADRSKKEGIPPYIICTNKQLAQIVEKRPQTIAQLGNIEGFGKVKIEKYGDEILEIITIKPTTE
jgi:superfamily II DNA helicase RecQ